MFQSNLRAGILYGYAAIYTVAIITKRNAVSIEDSEHSIIETKLVQQHHIVKNK